MGAPDTALYSRRVLLSQLNPTANYPANFGSVATVDPSLGPCMLELESQDCFVEWWIWQTRNAVELPTIERTGPAGSRALVYVERGARIEARIRNVIGGVLPGVTYCPCTGLPIAVAASAPYIGWRVWPRGAGGLRRHLLDQAERLVMLAGAGAVINTSDTVDALCPGAGAFLYMFAPGYAREARVFASAAMTWGLYNIQGGVPVVFRASAAVTDTVYKPGSWASLRCTGAAGTGPCGVLWAPGVSV